MLSKISSSSTTYASKTFLCIKTDYNDVTNGRYYIGGYRCIRNKKSYTFFKEALRMSTQTIRTGSQDCSTKKKVSVLIINSLLHAVMSSIHCAGAGYYFFKGHARGTREGEDSSSFLPSRVLEITFLEPATQVNIVLTFVLLSVYQYLPFR